MIEFFHYTTVRSFSSLDTKLLRIRILLSRSAIYLKEEEKEEEEEEKE